MTSAAGHGTLGWPLERAVEQRGRATAVIFDEHRVTYEELGRRIGALGASLDALGVGTGGRVGVLAANSLAHLECFIGIPTFGRVIVDLNLRLAATELVALVDDAEIEVLVCDAAQLEVARELRQRCPSIGRLVLDGAGGRDRDVSSYEQLVAGSPRAFPVVAEGALAAISYTGGTTGLPKGVMLSHENLLANARHNLIATGHRAQDRWLHVCPMFHAAGTANVLAATWVGATQVVLPRFEAAAVLGAIERHAITHIALVPTMLAALLSHDATHPADLTTLRHIQYAASPIAPDLQRRVLERFDCDVAQFYGMTEAAPTVSQCTPEDHARGRAGEEPFKTRLGSMGAPVVGVKVEIRDSEGRLTRAGEVGEIWVRGPNVMMGYWRRPETTAEALVDGWYRTGDGAWRDEDGYLYMVDRLKDMIISGAENVYPVEVEAALGEHPAVLEVAVFGVPHEQWGEAVHAVVSLEPGAEVDPEELRAFASSLIARFKVPRRIEIISEPLPKSGAGKILKARLREPHWTGRVRQIN